MGPNGLRMGEGERKVGRKKGEKDVYLLKKKMTEVWNIDQSRSIQSHVIYEIG